ncbi:hypothetical protein PROFUN_13731 [Planoprotostelium fungivorum]|uniref:Uncharacterized protein n=1 Tax=Planoprotostelium fungivorum TaxID=1890364 RepID=A0A2P6MWV7_9EUKA|nr:hypothetical protein PROFUN_13731 [Planoprotostelium fungivorum]
MPKEPWAHLICLQDLKSIRLSSGRNKGRELIDSTDSEAITYGKMIRAVQRQRLSWICFSALISCFDAVLQEIHIGDVERINEGSAQPIRIRLS